MPCNRAVVGRRESRPPGLWTTGKLPKRMSGHDKADRGQGSYVLVQRGQRTEDTKFQNLAQRFDRISLPMAIGGGPFFYWSAGRCAVTDAPLEQLAVCRCARGVAGPLKFVDRVLPVGFITLVATADPSSLGSRSLGSHLGSRSLDHDHPWITIPWITIPWITIPWITIPWIISTPIIR